MPLGTEIGRGLGYIVLDVDAAPPPLKIGGTAAPLFGPCLLWSNVRSSQQLLRSGLKYAPTLVWTM